MYLLAIVTLIVGILSIYAQVLSLQAARIAANQTGFAQTMMEWHGAAVSMASKIISTNQYAGPCSLTFNSALTPCNAPTGSGSANGTVTDGGNNLNYIASGELVHLPTGYNAVSYQFYSVLYEDATTSQPYVVTYVGLPTASYGAGGGGFIKLASGYTTSVSLGDLMHQFQVADIPTYLYGTVNASGVLQTIAYLHNAAGNGVSAVYTIPAAAGVPNGVFAVASSPIGF